MLVDGGDGVGRLGWQTDRIWDMRAMIIIDALPLHLHLHTQHTSLHC